ncbi:MAG: lantibiotic dehydratase [Chitinophagaceae bacterium]|nr:lantibiotic dehydratase [Chitinophagaceae bacterium]
MVNDTVSVSQYSFSDTLVLRTPAYSCQGYAGKNWDRCLEEPFFRASINIASQSLYGELNKHRDDISKLPAKCLNSLWKYHNRMLYRPTPFGLCSGFSTIQWSAEYEVIRLPEHIRIHLQPDYKSVLTQASSLLADSGLQHHYLPNPSIYPVQDNYRYMRYFDGQQPGKRTFQIQALDRDMYTAALLLHCTKPLTEDELSRFIATQFGFSEQESSHYVQSLVAAQVFIPVVQANITGEDYLHRVRQLIGSKEQAPFDNSIYTGAKEDFNCKLLNEAGHTYYVNMERSPVCGGLSEKYQQVISDGLYCLERLVPFQPQGGLQDFIKAFRNKFDKQCLPLLQALDPEVGIGYQGLGTARDIPAILKDIAASAPASHPGAVTWTAAHALLMQKWNAAGTYGALQLSETDLEYLTLPPFVLPNSCSVMFRVCNEGVYIEHAGGVTATAIAGRFTALNENVYRMAKELAVQEEEANPGILFAELAYISDLHTANIDRRENLYSFEIPVLCGSVIEAEKQIALNDIWVCIEGDEIVLWSKKHRRRIIPRLSSAFNYVRSDLAVFRFLCDLQYQGLRPGFSLDMEYFFPGLSFYPRTCYKTAILHLAKWVLKRREFEHVIKADISAQLTEWRMLSERLQLPRHISVDQYDHQLVFDQQDSAGMEQLLSLLKTADKIIIREYIFNCGEDALVQDEKGMPYIHQFIASLSHDRCIYRPGNFPLSAERAEESAKRLFIPGSEWLYYKLYIHPIRSNELIKNHILPCLHKLQLQGLVKKWFFIRYADPGYHLRLRFNIIPKQAGYAIFRLEKVLNSMAESGIIQSHSLSAYERELERYTPELITDCENWFCSSTALITAWIASVNTDDASYDYYAIVPLSVDIMLRAFGYGDTDAARLFEDLYQGMSAGAENNPGTKQVQSKYRELKQAVFMNALHTDMNAGALKKPYKLFRQSLYVLAEKCRRHMDTQRKELLFSDLVHMHFNRLLVTDSYRQEMILYYALWKHYQSAAYLAVRPL